MPIERVWQAYCEDDGWRDQFVNQHSAQAALSRHRKEDHAGKNCRVCGLDRAGHDRRNAGKPGPVLDPHDFQPGRPQRIEAVPCCCGSPGHGIPCDDCQTHPNAEAP